MSEYTGANSRCWVCGRDVTNHASGCPNKIDLSDLKLPPHPDTRIDLTDMTDLSSDIAEQIEAEEIDQLRENAGDPVGTESTVTDAARDCLYHLHRANYGVRDDDGEVLLLCSPATRTRYADVPAGDGEAFVSIDGAKVLASLAVDDDEIIGVHTAALRPHPVYSDRVLVIEPAGVVRARIEPYEMSHGYVDLGAHESETEYDDADIWDADRIRAWKESNQDIEPEGTTDDESPFDIAQADATRWRAIIDDRIRQFHAKADKARSRGNPERQRAFRQAAESLEVTR